MGFVAMTFAVIVLTRFKHDVNEFYQAVDWDLILFFMSLFVVINVMEHAQVLALIGHGVSWMIGDGTSHMGTTALLIASSLFSSVTDNIPLSAMLAKILANLNIASDSSLWWSVVFGANLGGNITPIGSASTLVAATIIHKYQLKMSFVDFVKTASPFALMQIVMATLYVLVVL
jgi:Na+/H+ antiporter NhaD/arsenite permease-like protein